MRQSRRLFLLAGLVLFSAMAGCDSGTDPVSGPTHPAPLLGLGGPSFPGYTLANDPIVPALLQTVTGLLQQPLSVTGLIGVGGGNLSILGHTLHVPAGAVLQSTRFTLNVLPSGYVQVQLTATRTGLLGRLLNVGEAGFQEPVPVTLTYSRSTNVTNPSQLIILREQGANGLPEPMPSQVDLVNKTVTAELDHFSRYYVAFPN